MANTINKPKKNKSKRMPVRLRHKIEKASAAKQRKLRRLAKKDPTWRSKLKKDPGIPNLLPYKEKMLQEVAQRKQQYQDQLARKQELVKVAKTGGDENEHKEAKHAAKDFEGDTAMEIDIGDESANPMAALLASARAAARDYERELESNDEMDEDDNDNSDTEEQVHMASTCQDKSRKAFDKAFKQVVEQADVVLYVLDARDPQGTRSREVERSVMAAASGGKRLILILNKVDLVPRQVLRGWRDFLCRYFPTIPFRAAGSAPNARIFNHKDMSVTATATSLMHSLKSYATSRSLKRAIRVGVVGYPNVGKSSVINALLARVGNKGGSCPTGAEAGVTTSIQLVKIDSKLIVLDSPGIVFPSITNAINTTKLSKREAKAHLVLLNAVPPKQIDDPVGAVALLLKRLSSSQELLRKLLEVYDVPPLLSKSGDCTSDFLIQVARKRGRLGRGGIPHIVSAATTVVTDWRDGRIQGWVEPPQQNGNSFDKSLAGMDQFSVGTSGDDEVPPDRKTIVSDWAEEFKLEGLLEDGGSQADSHIVMPP